MLFEKRKNVVSIKLAAEATLTHWGKGVYGLATLRQWLFNARSQVDKLNVDNLIKKKKNW